MNETKRCYKLNGTKYRVPELTFRVTDGSAIIHDLTEFLWTNRELIEIELTIRYLDEVK